MKKILKYMLFCLPFLAAGCSEDDLRFSYDAPEDSMHLTPSTEAVVLNPGMKQDVAVTFTWNNATPREGAKTMTYYFKMDIAGNSFATSYVSLKLLKKFVNNTEILMKILEN